MKSKILAVIVAFVVVFTAVTVFAGNGKGQESGACSGINCTGTALVCSGVVQTIAGTVVTYGMPGLVVDTGTSSELFYGMGPAWYWEKNNVDRPEIGEAVTLETESVIIGTTTRQVIVSITVGDQTLMLRDSATCLPLWRGQR